MIGTGTRWPFIPGAREGGLTASRRIGWPMRVLLTKRSAFCQGRSIMCGGGISLPCFHVDVKHAIEIEPSRLT